MLEYFYLHLYFQKYDLHSPEQPFVHVDLSAEKYIMETWDIGYLAHKSQHSRQVETHKAIAQHLNYWKIHCSFSCVLVGGNCNTGRA